MVELDNKMEQQSTFHSQNMIIDAHNVAGRDIIIQYLNEGGDDVLICPYCGTAPDEIIQKNEIVCGSCNERYYKGKPKLKVSKFINVPTESIKAYEDLMYLIVTKIKLQEYQEAIECCNKVIELSSKTPQGWEYKALCSYFLMSRDELIETKATKIIEYLNIAQKQNNQSTTYDEIAKTIAHRLFHIVRKQVFWTITHNQNIFLQRYNTSSLLQMWEICYQIYPEVDFLKQLTRYYTGQQLMTWIGIRVVDWDTKEYSLIDNSHFNGQLFNKLNQWKKEINIKELDYELPLLKVGDIESVCPVSINDFFAQRKLEEKRKAAQLELLDNELKQKKKEMIQVIIGIVIVIIILSIFFSSPGYLTDSLRSFPTMK
jgi:hypothetical protein